MIGCLDDNIAAEYADGVLSPEHSVDVETHLDSCADCRRHVSSLVAVATSVEASPGEATEPGERVGRYLIVHPLGRGAMGEVLLAYDPELDRRVAVKLLRPELWAGGGPAAREQLRLEAQAMARLAHPNVVRVFDVGVHEDRLFVAMEYVDGLTLARWAADRPRSLDDCVQTCIAAGRGLAAAHAAGIVHRDVKPENVMVGHDGRVLVSDFGLARVPVADEDTATHTAVIGTPAYLAPELYDGRLADARADQFGFAVTAWRVMTGEHPYAGSSFAELAANAAAGRLRPLPAGVKLPARIRRALERGLAADPARRFPSIAAMLAELEPLHRRTRAALIAGCFAVLLVALAIGLASLDDPGDRCRASTPAPAWDSWRDPVRGAFESTRRSDAGDAFERVDARLRDQDRARASMHRDACAATYDRRTQSHELFDRRIACLDRDRTEAAALAAELARVTTGEELDRAVSAVAGLRAVQRCGDVATLLVGPDPPAGAAAHKIEGDLATARARDVAGRYGEAHDVAARAVTAAVKVDHPGLIARAFYTRAQIELRLARNDDAEASLRTGAEAAARAEDDETAARIWASLAELSGGIRARPDEGLIFAWVAELAARRAGGSPDLRALVEGARSAVLSRRGDLEGAVAATRRGVELFTEAHGEKHVLVGRAHQNLCSDLSQLGRFDEALVECARAKKILTAALGEGHNQLGITEMTIATVHARRGMFADAEAAYSRAIAILEPALGLDHPHVALGWMNLANLRYSTGRYEDAEAGYRRALVSLERQHGADHPDVAMILHNLGMLAFERGSPSEAEPLIARAIAIVERALGPDHVTLGMYVDNLGKVLYAQGRFEEAAVRHRRALHIAEVGGDPDGTIRPEALTGLGNAELELGHGREAVAKLEQALALRGPDTAGRYRATTRFTLARALWEVGRERPRARTLAKEALADLAADQDGTADQRAEIEAWLARRR